MFRVDCISEIISSLRWIWIETVYVFDSRVHKLKNNCKTPLVKAAIFDVNLLRVIWNLGIADKSVHTQKNSDWIDDFKTAAFKKNAPAAVCYAFL